MGSSAADREGFIRPLAITASVLGIIQGVAWTVLCLLAILLYNDTMHIKTEPFDMGIAIYKLYLNEKSASSIISNLGPIIIGPKEFSYFMYPYLILSFCLLITSSAMLRNGLHGKRDSFQDKTIGAWVGTMTLLSLLDFILMCLIAHDYNRYKTEANQSSGSPEEVSSVIFLAAMGIVMTVAARGFVLWVTNVIFAIIFGRYCYDTYRKGATQNQPVLDAYETGPTPWLTRPTFDDPFQSGYDNKAFNDDQDYSLFHPRAKQQPFADERNLGNYNKEKERSNGRSMDLPQVDLDGPNKNNNYWNNRHQPHRGGNNRSATERDHSSPYDHPAPLRTAKIGRQGGQRSPPLHVPSPYIPDPDYSPPGSPRPRGVLRPKTNYAMY